MSLTTCLKKVGAALAAEDKAAVLARAGALRSEGLSATDAGRQAVDERLADVAGQIGKVQPLVPEVAQAAEPAAEFAADPFATTRLVLPEAADVADQLRGMGEGAFWAVEGGRLLRSGTDTPGDGGMGGEVVGRTSWVPADEWFGRMRNDMGASGLSNQKEIKAAIEKAIEGQPLNAKERRTIDWMRGEIRDMEAKLWELDDADQAAVDAFSHGLSSRDAGDFALTARAAEIDADAVERAAIRFENDDAGFMAEMRRIAGEQDRQAAGTASEPSAGPGTRSPSTAEPPPASAFDAFKAAMRAIYDGTASVEDYKAAYQRVREADAVKAELGKLTKDELIRTFGIMARPDEKKDSLISTAYKAMLRGFALGKEFGPRSYMMTRGGLENYERLQAEALDAIVENHTAEDLAAYAAEVKAERDEKIAKRAALVESVKDPQTLDDFRSHERLKMSEGLTPEQARMSLTPEQRAKRDELAASLTRERRKVTNDDQRTQVRVAGQTVDGNIIATKHTKKGHDLFVVQLAERVSREDYETLNAGAKKIGGYYSSFRGGGAIAGFQFTTREQAQAFVTLAGGDATAAKEAAQERRDAYADDRSQTASERLTEMADAMEAGADESLSRDRKANTDRRARFAAAAEASAREAKAMAKTMRNLAEALNSGKAKFLDRVRTKTQVQLLQTYVGNAKFDELRAKYPTYSEQEKHKGEPPTQETADHAVFPEFTAFRSDLASLGRQLQDVDGTKKLGDRLMKVADDVSDAFTAWAKEPGNLFRLSTFSVRAGDEVRTAIFKDRETAEKAIKRSGLTGKAIVFAEKRGVNRIIMSPSEAIARGLWTGDGDKRITLSDEFGAELVESMGRANRRGAKVSVPWQFERAYERRKQLQRMGIETPAEFRAALREFIGLREQAAEADKIKVLERAMVGRRNDGLDFFPTPEGVADEMIAAADLQPGMRVLEPSAGMGHIADQIRAAGAEPEVIEMANDRRELLEAKGFNVVGRDFLDFNDANHAERGFTFGDLMEAPDGTRGILRGQGGMGSDRVRLVSEDGRERGKFNFSELTGIERRGVGSGYDRILMNPPFSDRRDAAHVLHAYSLLKPGGRLVAIMGEGVFFGQDKKATAFREWMESLGASDEKLPSGTFMDPSLPVNTGVSARMVVIEKPEEYSSGDRARDEALRESLLPKKDEPRLSRRGSTSPATSQATPQTETPAFRRWFGDSKVVDAEGRPLVVYHGTTADFSEFDPDKRGSSTRVNDAKKGFFFVANGKAASEYTWKSGGMTGSVMPVYLSMQDPLAVDMPGEWAPGKYDAILDRAKSAGYDGVIIRGATTLGTPGDVYIAFRPEQIKSAIGNDGSFDPANPDIRFNRKGSSAVNLPPAAIGGSLARVNNHPDYAEAKAGDSEASLRLARDLVTDGFIEEVRQLMGSQGGVLLPVIAQESAGRNKIPLAVAEVLAERMGVETDLEIAQATRTHRTDMDGLSRVLKSPEFYGTVKTGQRYLLVDDTLTQGGTFASLANHIRAGGGEVLGVAALSGKRYSAALSLSDEYLTQLRERFGDVEGAFRAATGYGFDGLTESEGRYLVKHDAPEQVRDRILAAGREAGFREDAGVDGPGSRDRRLSSESPRERFRRLLGVPARGIPLAQARQMARAYEDAGLRGVNVAATPADLPADLRRRLEGAADDVRGAYFPDKDQTWVFADRVNDPDEFAFVVLHEAFHRGLGKTFGRDAKRLMGQMYQTNRRLRERADKVMADLNKEARENGGRLIDRDEAIEEALADMAGEGRAQKLRGWTKLSALIRTWLGKVLDAVGLRMTFSDAQIETFVSAMAREGLRNDVRVTTGMQVGRLASASKAAMPNWYSEMARQIDRLPMAAAPAKGWLDTIRGMTAKGVKQDEIEWSGVADWLQMQTGKVSKQQVLEFLAANGVQVQEVTLGAQSNAEADKAMEKWGIVVSRNPEDENQVAFLDRDNPDDLMTADELESAGYPIAAVRAAMEIESGGVAVGTTGFPKYSQYTLPGGTNYREVLLTLPTAANEVWMVYDPKTKKNKPAKVNTREGAIQEAGGDLGRVMAVDEADNSKQYKSGHWDQPNILAHIRLNDRTDADGNRVLFVEEVQSDWGQEGKKRGFKADKLTEQEQERYEDLLFKSATEGLTVSERREYQALNDRIEASEDPVPSAPFVTKTDGWLNLALKRIIKMAADGGYDRVAFVNGQQSAERFSLDKHLSELRYEPAGEGLYEISGIDHNLVEVISEDNITIDRVEELVGKEMAEKIANGEGEKGTEGGYRDWRSFSGDGLKIEAKGMRAFYDQIVPNAAKALLKKLGGGQMATVPVSSTKTVSSRTGPRMGRWDEATMLEQPGFDVTPAMREKAAGGMPLFSRRASTSLPAQAAAQGINIQSIRNAVMDRFRDAGTKVSWWDKTLGTQFDKAKRLPAFGKVFDRVQQYLEDTSTLANEAADQAPSILPKLDSVRDVWDAAKRGLNDKDRDAIKAPIFEGTLLWTRDENGKLIRQEDAEAKADKLTSDEKSRVLLRSGKLAPGVLKMWLGLPIDQYEQNIKTSYAKHMLEAGAVFTPDELRSLYKLTDAQIKQYQEFRAAVNTSLDQVVATDALRMLGDVAELTEELHRAAVGDREGFRAALNRILDARIEAGGDEVDVNRLKQLRGDLEAKYAKVDALKARGYAPLMRFGTFKVVVPGKNGEDVDFFALYETKAEANAAARSLNELPEFRGRVEQGTLSEEAYKLFAQVPLESLEMFAEAIGAEQSEVFQEYLRMAKNNRSALKRLIQRKGIAGFNEDVSRVLASFVTSNARMAAGTVNLAQAKEAAQGIREGDVRDEAIRLIETVQNPTETAGALRGLMFVHFIGGSIASAIVNVTQPVMMTTPYLSQWGGMAKASARLLAASRQAATGKVADKEMAEALRRAEKDGIVSPQEIHHLTAEAMQSFGRNPFMKRAAFIWGAPFSLAEQFNRRVTFLAAYQTAKAEGMADPFAFAERAVIETQGLYNKGNASNWARNPIGAVALTFKQYSIHYLEWLRRMWNTGAPNSPERKAGRRAVWFALIMLALAGGVEGLPFMEDLNDIVDTFLQAAGIDTSAKGWKRDAIANTLGLGDEGADVVMRGFSAMAGIPMDVSIRMGMGNLLPGTGIWLRSNTDVSRDVLELAGPAGSLLSQAKDAGKKALSGDAAGAATALLPVALQNAAKGVQMLTTGEARDTKGRKIMDADEMDAAMKIIGFQPAEIARESSKIGMERKRVQLTRNVEMKIADLWAQGLRERDADMVQEARQELLEWNQANPQSRIQITNAQVLKRLKDMQATRAERFQRAAPRELRQGLAVQ